MKKILKKLISKFKKFWDKKKEKDISTNSYMSSIYEIENEKSSALPLEFVVSNIGGYNFYDLPFSDIAVKKKKTQKKSVYIKDDLTFLVVIIHTRN